MADRSDPPKPDPTRVLKGLREPPERPDPLYVTTMRLTITGTETALKPNGPAAAKWLAFEAEEKAAAERAKLEFAKVPTAPPQQKEGARNFSRDPGPGVGKMRPNERDNDLEL